MESDDDIEIIESVVKSRENDDICQLCSSNLRGLTLAERHDHHQNGHNSGQSTGSRRKHRTPKPASVTTPQRKPPPMKLGKSANIAVKEDVFWYPTQEKALPDNYTPGVLSILKQALNKSHKKGATKCAVLCYEQTPHIFRETFDMAWGCGYRNFLMACTALMGQPTQSVYFTHLDSPSPPSVRNLQHWIEDAWKDGYDEIGAHELDHKLVNTNKKIGTGELYVAFTSRKIPCTLVDFDLRKDPKGFDTLIDWVVNYFTEKLEGDINQILRAKPPVVATTKMPVIMQYEGHSVTIVGYELVKSGKYNLLVFDPSSKVTQDIRRAALSTSTTASSSPLSLGKSKRRERSKSPASRKRSRTDQDSNDGVTNIPDSDDEKIDDARRAVALESALDPEKVIKLFRFTKAKKKLDYQFLYFTMGDPLSDREQTDRKVVLAEC